MSQEALRCRFPRLETKMKKLQANHGCIVLGAAAASVLTGGMLWKVLIVGVIFYMMLKNGNKNRKR